MAVSARDETRAAAAALLRGEVMAIPHLRVTAGPGEGRRLPLRDEQTLGRGREADLRLDDPGASRLHVRLSRSRDGYVASDLGSKNGLCVNGRRCTRPRALRAGDELTIGGTRLVFDGGQQATDGAGEPSAAGAQAEGRPAPGAAPLPLTAAAALVLLAALLLALPLISG
jgi:pSer/pThr/pTyr-binding forkhead associated (FHA) protein